MFRFSAYTRIPSVASHKLYYHIVMLIIVN